MHICLLGNLSAGENFSTTEVCGLFARCRPRNSHFLGFLLLHNLLVLLQKIFEVACDPDHPTVQSVDPSLNGALMGPSGLLGHVLGGAGDFLLIDLDLSQLVLDLDAQLRHVVLARCEQRVIFLKEIELTLVALDVVDFEVGFCKLGYKTVPGLSPLTALKQVLSLAQIGHR